MRARSLATPAGWLAALVVVSVLVTGSVAIASRPTAFSQPAPTTAPRRPAVTPALPAVPAQLTDSQLGLRSGPVAIPLRLDLPSLGIKATMLGVGILPDDTMDAPKGPRESPIWDQAFWYRGSAVPGAPSTALIAGHVDGPDGRSAVFGRLGALAPGDPIVLHDTRTGLTVPFAVTETRTYSLAEAREPGVLARIYGAGPVAGTAPQLSPDHRAHLTLITCAGTFRAGTHDHRLVVYATRTD
jgi:Sortase domain